MSFTIDFDSLMNGYIALMLQCNGVDVELRVPEHCGWMCGDVIFCGFFSSDVFTGRDSHMESYASIERAYETLNAMSPNTIYMERAFAVQDRNLMRDFVNHFRGKAFRDVYESQVSGNPCLSAGCQLTGRLVFKRAPAYRFNASRHVVSLLRTLKARGASVVMGGCAGADGGSFLSIYSIPNGITPVPQNTVMLPGGVWLFNRCSSSYVAVLDGGNPAGAIREAFDGCALADGDIAELARVSYDINNDDPLNAWAKACRYLDEHGRGFGISCPVDMSSLRLDGSDFEFRPSAPDVLGYADCWFDTVKRMGINVNTFRNAVYDYGTHIEDIVNAAYDLYPVYHNGPTAFDEAVRDWKSRELVFVS